MLATITGTGNGSTPVVNLTFPFIEKAHVKASIDGEDVTLKWNTATQVQLVEPAPVGAFWKVYRDTPTTPPVVDYTNGSVLTDSDLDLAETSHRYRDEELADLVTLEGSDRDAAIADEAAAREAAINAEAMARQAALDQEINDRENGDNALRLALSGATLTSATLPAANRGALADLDHTLGAAALLSEGNREGIFVPVLTDVSAGVTADPNQGVYVAFSSDPTGASGAWVRKFDGPVLAAWFGVSFTSADNYADFNAARAVAVFLKKPLRLPEGTLTINQATPLFSLSDNEEITGFGPGRTILHFTGLGPQGEVFQAINKSRVRLADFRMEASILQVSGQVAVSFKDSMDCLVENVHFDKWTNSVIFWTVATPGAVPPQATNARNKAINCVSFSSRSYAFFMNFATACEFLYCEAYNASNQDGFKFGGGTIFAKVLGCHAEGNAADGFDTYDGFISSVIADTSSFNNGANGFQFKGTFGGTYGSDDYPTRESVYSNLIARGNGLAGILWQETRYGVASGIIADGNGTSGVILNNVHSMHFAASLAARNLQHGWSLIGVTSDCSFAACAAVDNSYTDGVTQSGLYDGWNFGSASTCSLNGCSGINGTETGKIGGQGYAFNTTTSAGIRFNGCAAGRSVHGPVGGTNPYTNNQFASFDSGGPFLGWTATGVGGEVSFTQATDTVSAYVQKSGGASAVVRAGTAVAQFGSPTGFPVQWLSNNLARWSLDVNGHFAPVTNNDYDLGSNTLRPRVVYANSVVTGSLVQSPAPSVTPANNGQVMFELPSNTALNIKVKGSDGVVRSASLVLA